MQLFYTIYNRSILGYIQIMKHKKLWSPAMLKREDAGGGVEGRWYGDHLGKRSGCCLEKGRGWMEVSWVFNEKKWMGRWALTFCGQGSCKRWLGWCGRDVCSSYWDAFDSKKPAGQGVLEHSCQENFLVLSFTLPYNFDTFLYFHSHFRAGTHWGVQRQDTPKPHGTENIPAEIITTSSSRKLLELSIFHCNWFSCV